MALTLFRVKLKERVRNDVVIRGEYKVEMRISLCLNDKETRRPKDEPHVSDKESFSHEACLLAPNELPDKPGLS